MSRSKRKTPISGVAGTKNTSCKQFKKQEHQRYRAYVRGMLHHEKYDDIQDFKGKFCNEWSSPRDGKTHWFSYKYWECGEYTKGWATTSWWYIGDASCGGKLGHWHCKMYYNELMRK